jgi:hypothetical protein
MSALSQMKRRDTAVSGPPAYQTTGGKAKSLYLSFRIRLTNLVYSQALRVVRRSNSPAGMRCTHNVNAIISTKSLIPIKNKKMKKPLDIVPVLYHMGLEPV